MSADIRGNAAAKTSAGDLTPGEHLRAEIKRLALDQVAVSKATGVSRQSINNIINGRQPISRAMAGKLGRLTGHSSDYWLRASFPAGRHTRQDAPRRADMGGVLVDHQIAQAVKDRIVGIAPFSVRNLRAASIELSLDDFVIAADGKRVGIGGRKSFLLRAGGLVSVRTKERIGLPRDHLGRVGALDWLVRAGAVTLHPWQIEPGFDGHVYFSLFNAGRRPLRLRAGEPVIGLEIVRLGATPSAAILR